MTAKKTRSVSNATTTRRATSTRAHDRFASSSSASRGSTTSSLSVEKSPASNGKLEVTRLGVKPARKQLTEEDRIALFKADPWAASFTGTTAHCKGCGKHVKLDTRRTEGYYRSAWEKHLFRCEGARAHYYGLGQHMPYSYTFACWGNATTTEFFSQLEQGVEFTLNSAPNNTQPPFRLRNPTSSRGRRSTGFADNTTIASSTAGSSISSGSVPTTPSLVDDDDLSPSPSASPPASPSPPPEFVDYVVEEQEQDLKETLAYKISMRLAEMAPSYGFRGYDSVQGVFLH